MKKISNYLAAFFLCVFVLAAVPARAQLVIGQYEDEAPFRTWNTLGFQSASAAGMGGVRFALVADSSASVVNPARLTALPKFSFTLSSSYTSASFYRYAIVNTGVLGSEKNSTMGVYALDFGGITFAFKGWALGISIGLLESYGRPSQNPDYEYAGEVQYSLEFRQSGLLRNYNLSLARNFGERISIGIGMNYVSGSMEKTIVENIYYDGVTISDQKSHDFKGFYINGGFVADLNPKLTIAAVFRTPYTKEANSKSILHYDSPLGNTDIRHEVEAKNKFKQPFVCGIGVDYRFSPQFRAASDVSYFNWSSYSVTYYDEEIKREFKDIIKVSGGLEYLGSLRFLQQDVKVPIRVGLSYDPQPVKEPRIRYIYFTFGFGMHWKQLYLDAGAMFGGEKGSGRNQYGRKFSITLSYFL
jgi:long-subunit fatty acid transport protein